MRSKAPVLVLVLVASAAACSRQPAPQATPVGGGAPSARPSATAVPIRIETRGGDGQYVSIVETIRGRKVYTIRALSGSVQQGGSAKATGVLEQPHVTFLDKGGAATIADAPKASIAERDKSVVMTGGVRARTSTGTVLTCDTLTYTGNAERFHGEGHVRLLSAPGPDSVTISGDRIDGDVKLQDVKITRNSR